MAADQRKRRLSSSTAFGYGLQGQNRVKKRDLRSPQYECNFNSHVLFNNGSRVIGKDEQVGVSCRHLNSFVSSLPHFSNTKVADVVTVPREIFEFDDLSEVLSYEVWQSLFSEKEKNYLSQFLPRGIESDRVVEALLSGDNFHFGNPSLKWGASLCSGDIHPDAINLFEKSLKAKKKVYYSELQLYHDNMIRNLQKLKERCASSKDPMAEVMQMMSRRSRRYTEKSNFPDANVFRSRRAEEAVVSESPSSVADDKSYYSDNLKLSTIRDAEIQKRMRNEEVLKDRHDKLVTRINGVKVSPKLKKAKKLQKVNINSNDGAKYMSYVKISKKQHELVKSMKQSGSSIQSKTLNRVLGGNLDSSNVKPYEMFVEEEQKRIYEFWSNLANKDVPSALHSWRNMQLERRQIMDSVLHEMGEKLMPLAKDDEVVCCGLQLQVQDEPSVSSTDKEAVDPQDMDGESSRGTSEQHQDDVDGDDDVDDDNGNDDVDDDNGNDDDDDDDNDNDKGDDAVVSEGYMLDDNKESYPSSMQQESPVSSPPFSVHEGFEPSSIGNQCSVQDAPLNVAEESYLSSIDNQSSRHSPPLNVNEEFNPMDLNAETDNVNMETSDFHSTMTGGQDVAQTSEVCHNISQSECQNVSAASADEIPCSSVKNVWSSIGVPESYRHIPTTQYASVTEPSLSHSEVGSSQPARLIDLESDLPEEDATKDLLNRHDNHVPFFNPYPNRDRSELLQSLIKHDNYQHEQKKAGLDFHPTTNVMLEPPLFPGHFREQLQPSFALDNRQKSQNEQLFINQNIQDNFYPDNRYSLEGQGHFSSLNVRDWNNTRFPTPIQPPPQMSSGELLNHNWFASENRAPGGWSSSDCAVFSSPSLGSGSGGDQSLYSVLSQCSTLHSRASYNPVTSTEQIIPPPNYGQDIAGGIPMTSSNLAQTGSPFDYLGGSEAGPSLKNTNMGWMSLGQQAPSLHDPSGKPFLKSWNQ